MTLGDLKQAEGWAFPSIGEAVAWLRDQAIVHYPNSEFARKYAQKQRGCREQRCWVHKTANILNKMPKSLVESV